MTTLILDNKTLSLSQQGERIKIAQSEQAPKTIPFSHITRVVISSNINIESRLLRTLATKDISVAFINPRKPEEYALLQGSGHNDASRKITQLKASQNIIMCQDISHYLVEEKLQQQIQLLKNTAPKKPNARYAIIKAVPVIENALARMKNEPRMPLNSLRGLEGSAAAAYFSAFTQVFPSSYNFTHRNRRPPKDPINALLSLSYTLADSLICQRLQIIGLDLMIGFYHQLSWSRHSLSSDIIEPVRPMVDEWVRMLIAKQHIKINHFKEQGEGCYLKKLSRQIYYEQWEYELKSLLTKEIDKHIKHVCQMLGIIDGH